MSRPRWLLLLGMNTAGVLIAGRGLLYFALPRLAVWWYCLRWAGVYCTRPAPVTVAAVTLTVALAGIILYHAGRALGRLLALALG